MPHLVHFRLQCFYEVSAYSQIMLNHCDKKELFW